MPETCNCDPAPGGIGGPQHHDGCGDEPPTGCAHGPGLGICLACRAHRAEAEVLGLTDRLAAVERLHCRNFVVPSVCSACSDLWPCPTITALRDQA